MSRLDSQRATLNTTASQTSYTKLRDILGVIWSDSRDGTYPYVVGNNTILYNPNASCGSSNVFIQNGATAALYSYTPYQPNQSALNAQYGLGDACGAYGNRNFLSVFQ